MELSQRIKAARLEAGLSQRQLCGDVITRNMLSLIESGRARPSMDTLRHFSQMLGKPISYFLEEDAVTSPNQAIMQTAENAYAAKDFSAVLAALEDYRAPDAVFDQTRYLLELLACQKLAAHAIAEGKNAYALALLDRAETASAHTVYGPAPAERAILRWQADSGAADPACVPITDALMLRAEAALQARDAARAARLLDAADETPPRWCLLRGTAAMDLGDTEGAVRYLTAAEAAYPGQVIPLLEKCYLQLGDYRHAYEYAKKATAAK